MNQQRIKKLEQASNRIITSYIIENLQDLSAEFGVINITGVKISSDISYLDVFVSCTLSPETLPKALAKHAYALHKKISSDISIRKLPKIRFRYDNS